MTWFYRDENPFQTEARLKFLNAHDVDVWQETIACPVQFYGSVEGYALYYRSRGNHWHVEIGKDFEYHGEDCHYGWTPPHVTLVQIWQAVKQWRKQVAPDAKSVYNDG